MPPALFIPYLGSKTGLTPPVGGGAPWHSTGEARPSFAIVRWLRFPVRLPLPVASWSYAVSRPTHRKRLLGSVCQRSDFPCPVA